MTVDNERAHALAVLGLDARATGAEIESAYRRLVRQHHPDRNATGSTERFLAILDAHRTLRVTPVPASSAARPVSQPVRVTRRGPHARAQPPVVAGPVSYAPWRGGEAR